ncbi:MAG TPA: tetratricopeptide repeat protein [Chthonomonadaceae bacterium]|nr:tetratricopeptide repeat protein [Chthonomonadaceae bacterium]
MDARCRIELFGGLRLVRSEGITTRFRTAKAAGILAFLALRIREHVSRELLVELFWPNMEFEAARGNLRTSLNSLRKQIEPAGVPYGGVLIADRQCVRLNSDAVTTDADEFGHALACADRASDVGDRIGYLHNAVRLYTGDLLPGRYDDWAIQEQSRCRIAYHEALGSIASLSEGAGDLDAALSALRKMSEEDPLNEEACQAQMRVCLPMGRASAALECYERLQQCLNEQLGIAPSAKTHEMAELLRRAVAGQSAARDAVNATRTRESRPRDLRDAPAGTDASHSANASLMPPGFAAQFSAIPLQITRFFGRANLLDDLIRLMSSPATRLVTLLGPGGIGKTRLAIEAAGRLSPTFRGQVWFVALAELPDVRLVPAALIHALRLPPPAQGDPLEYVLEAIGDSRCLLVLDNFEHLLHDPEFPGKSDNPITSSSSHLVRLLLQRAPRLCCLVTSRQPLRLAGEHLVPVPPLETPLPSSRYSLQEAVESEAVALFVSRAQMAKPDFAITAANAPHVAALCRRLDGIPLAIEMAAAWSRLLIPSAMIEQLDRQFDLLINRRRDLPERHRSLRAAFCGSLDQVGPEARSLMRRLAVFRGGCTLDAIEAVCFDARALFNVLDSLAELQEYSIIHSVDAESGPRYRLLEPLRELVLESALPEDENINLHRRHVDFYAKFAEASRAHIAQRSSREWISRVAIEHDNIRAALQWCLSDESAGESALKLVVGMIPFWTERYYLAEARRWIDAFLPAAYRFGDLKVLGQLLKQAGFLALLQGDVAAAGPLCGKALDVARATANPSLIASALSDLAGMALGSGELDKSCRLYREALEVIRDTGDQHQLVLALSNLGVAVFCSGAHLEAIALHREGHHIAVQRADRKWVALTALNIAIAAVELGDYDGARRFLRETLDYAVEHSQTAWFASSLERLACLVALDGRTEQAARIWGACSALRDEVGIVIPFDERPSLETHISAARTRAGHGLFQRSWKEGGAMSREELIDYVSGLDARHADRET